MGLLLWDKNQVDCATRVNLAAESSCVDVFPSSNELEIWVMDARGGDLTDRHHTIENFYSVSLIRSLKVKWDY